MKLYDHYPSLSFVKKILVIKLRHLGDVVLSTAVLSTLHSRFLDSEIDVAVYEEAQEMVRGIPGVRHVYGLSRKKGPFWRKALQTGLWWKKLREERYDLVLNLTEGERGAFAALWTGAPLRVGFSPRKKWQKRFYTHVVREGDLPRHRVEQDLDALRVIGIFPEEEEKRLVFPLDPSAVERMQDKVGEGFYLVHPFSRWRFKCLPVATMRAIVEELVARGERVVLLSGPDETEKKLVKAIGEGLLVTMFLGTLSLQESGALVFLSRELLCVDSVMLHIASALRKKVVVLFGPTSEVKWGPWQNPQARVVALPFPCRPCLRDGCGGSKYSECLHRLSKDSVLYQVSAPPFSHLCD